MRFAVIAATARESGRTAQLVLGMHPALLAALARSPAQTREDAAAQLARLLHARFLLRVPPQRVREMPRYLKALQYRLEKALQDPARDLKLQREVAAIEGPYWRAVQAEQGRRPPERDAFRWLLEEYRVSLFAQHLKTAVAVSAKRLGEAWQARGSA